MKKYLVIGNPIEHSLSPALHNYWIKKNNIDAKYEKKLLQKDDIKRMVHEIKVDKIKNQLLIKGSVPGSTNCIVMITR